MLREYRKYVINYSLDRIPIISSHIFLSVVDECPARIGLRHIRLLLIGDMTVVIALVKVIVRVYVFAAWIPGTLGIGASPPHGDPCPGEDGN